MNIENVVTNILLDVASIGLAFMVVIFNIKMPPLFKAFDDKTDRRFAIAAYVFCDILLICAIILVANGIIEKL